MVNPVGTSHRQVSLSRLVSLNGDGPPKQTGLVTTTEINCAAAAGPESIAISRPNTTAINIGSWWDSMTVNLFFRTFAGQGWLEFAAYRPTKSAE